MNQIGQLNEQPLHHALKRFYAGEDGQIEVHLDGFLIDVVREGCLFEIQTGNFAAIRNKMKVLVRNYPVCLVFPVAQEKWLVKLPESGGMKPVTRRKSPKKGRIVEVFNELVSFPDLLMEPNFSLEIVLIREEQVREYHESRRWRQNGWKTVERRLLDVTGQRSYHNPAEIARLLPETLSQTFTTADLAEELLISRRLAQKMAYCLREMGILRITGKRGRSLLYGTNEN